MEPRTTEDNRQKHFIVDKIKVMIETNLPNKTSAIPLTKEMLYEPMYFKDEVSKSQLSTYPLITKSCKYPEGVLSQLNRGNQIRFFFQKTMFMRYTAREKRCTTEDEENDAIYHNVTLMLKILFPTKFPVILDNASSYEKYVRKSFNISLTLKGAVPFFKIKSLRTYFSYLKIEGKIYTVSSTTLLDDVYNHPLYHAFFEKCVEYFNTKDKKKEDIEDEIKEKQMVLDRSLTRDKTAQITRIFDKALTSIHSLTGEDGAAMSQTEYTRTSGIQARFEDKLKLKKITDIRQKIMEVKNDLSNNNNQTGIIKVSMETIAREMYNLNALIEEIREVQLFVRSDLTVLQPVFKISTEIIKLIEAKNAFFGHETASGNENDNNYFKTNFKEYNEFIQESRKVVRPIRSSTNKSFRENIENLIRNIGASRSNSMSGGGKPKEDKSVFGHDEDRFKDICEKIDKRQMRGEEAAVGISKINDSEKDIRFEAYVYITCIGGELNDDNVKTLTCDFRNHDLGNTFRQWLNRQMVFLDKSSASFIDVSEISKMSTTDSKNGEVVKNENPGQASLKPKASKDVPPLRPTVGGSTKRPQRRRPRRGPRTQKRRIASRISTS